MSKEASAIPSRKAAAYVRMSTEHQQYSTSNQMDIIEQYARQNAIKIVKTYSDDGKSGLRIQGRDALTQMIADVQKPPVGYDCILVYDVSRWGRFQDADESAYYEYICRRAGVSVHYCAEQFENDGSPVSTIVKSVKRAMAGEYSRELSSKVFQGACRLIQLGYHQGGTAGYGLRRILIDQNGNRKAELKMGEQKSLQTDRVVLEAGPKEEVKWVRWMYDQFVQGRTLEAEIAALLNEKAVRTDFDRAWTRATVHQILTNEKYIGNLVYHRTSFKLKKQHINNPPEKWIRCENAFRSIIEPELFHAAQALILARSQKLTDGEMLDKLRVVLGQQGRISGIIIDESEGVPSSSAYRSRFGSLVSAYRLIGYDPQIDYTFIEENRKLRKQHPELVKTVVERIRQIGGLVVQEIDSDLLHINGELSVSVVLCRHRHTPAGNSRWLIRLDTGLRPDITIAVRMDASNEGIRDYYLLPSMDVTQDVLNMCEENGICLDAYRFETLDFFLGMTAHVKIQEAA